MGKTKIILGGAVLGAGAMYLGLQYHLLLTPEGMLLVPRSPQHSLRESYADVQDWDAQTWADHPRLALAVAEHGRADLIGEGVKSGMIDGLRSSLTPDRRQLGETSRGWEPIVPGGVPEPIHDGKIAGTQAAPRHRAAPRRGFLPLSELLGLRSGAGPTRPAEVGGGGAATPVLPTGSARPPEVEFLPSPDDVDLGQPQPLPRRSNSQWRQSEVETDPPQRSAAQQGGWEPLTMLPRSPRLL